MARYLITGGAGFIGRHLVRHLLEEGHEVRILDDFSTGTREPFPERVEVIEGDACDATAAAAAVAQRDGVFHLVAMPSVIVSDADPRRNQRSGEVALLSILDAALGEAGVRRIVFASSAAVYANSLPLPVNESAETFPLSNYGVSKLAGEHYLRAACARQDRLDAVCLRIFNVYGPGQVPDSLYAGVIAKFLHALTEGRSPVLFGDGRQTRDFIAVQDVARACLLAMEAPGRLGGRPLNIAGGRGVPVNEVWSHLAEAAGSTLVPQRQPSHPAEIRDSVADVSTAEAFIGFRAQTALPEGLAALLPNAKVAQTSAR